MRLTPSWFRSSSNGSSEERPGDADTTTEVTIYHTSGNGFLKEDDNERDRVGELVPDSDARLLAVIDELQTPVTIDEITDQLIRPARPSIETWAGVHERLHRDRLPALDRSGEIDFDEAQGIVERSSPPANEGRLSSLAALSAISIGLVLVGAALVSASVLTAVVVSLITTFTLLFVPW